jgi:PIN domain nuclease of toxin-antitoxin system
VSVLLDTHYVFGLAGSPGAISLAERRFLDAYAERVVVSAVSIWEVRLKWNVFHKSGARKGPLSPEDVLEILSTDQIVQFLVLSPDHAAAKLEVPLGHRDPFDELLLAQAQVEGIKLLSRDRRLVGHPLVATIS